ncbi:MAG: hypothetical protein A3H95_14480 [Acidobacteria bacterium RIFCSPLOWO2_02_FULL_64_15]|nr:MAG: hypothetical protein A3H95_14480 [Acidobacteria bacterium RIFCSPLOWO2_02_FULL_64_15]
MRVGEAVRLARFFVGLTIKERFVPNWHVRPLVAELFLTENCNLRCVSCACWRSTTQGELTTVEWEDVLRQLADARFHKVNLTGGEPLIREDAIHLMEYATRLRLRHLHLNTNGISLVPPTIERILAAGVRSFNISIDGPRELHDRIRGRVGAFDQTVDHLRNLADQRARLPLRIRLNFTLMRDNVAALPAVAELAQELKVRLYLNLATDKTFLFRDEAVAHQTQVSGAELGRAFAQLERLARRRGDYLPRYSDLHYAALRFSEPMQRSVPCAESQLKLMVHSRGEIGGCWGHDPTANVRHTPIRDVIDSVEYRTEHARLFRKDCVGCGSNYSLNLRWRPGTYLDDLLWQFGRRRMGTS